VALVKPEFEIFLTPILKQMKFLELGISFEIVSGLTKILRFYLLYGVFDKPARASILNIISCNGYYGCLKCIQPGKTINHVHLYKFLEDNPAGPLRNKNVYEQDCLNQSYGIKGKIGLSELRFFSPLYNTNIDYMHSILEGVIKRFFRYWFDQNCSQSIKMYSMEIDKRLLSIKPPSFIPVCPRSIDTRAKWRANEFLSFLLFYSLPVLFGILKSEYFLNLMKLVLGMECLLNRKISRENLVIVKKILISFVKEAQEIYPEDIMVSGMHEILHLVDCTLEFGPLNCNNSFQFEELNRKIIRLISGKDLIGDEFLKLFSVLQALTYFSFKNDNKVIEKYFEENNIIKTSNKKASVPKSGIFTPLGEIFEASIEVQNKILSDFPEASVPLKCCLRLSFDGVIYTTSQSETKNCDFCVKTLGEKENYGFIEVFAFNKNNAYVIMKKITNLSSCFYDPNHPELKSQMFLCNVTKKTFTCRIENLAKSFLINVGDNRLYMSTFSISHLFM
jgi:hypothetical protein